MISCVDGILCHQLGGSYLGILFVKLYFASKDMWKWSHNHPEYSLHTMLISALFKSPCSRSLFVQSSRFPLNRIQKNLKFRPSDLPIISWRLSPVLCLSISRENFLPCMITITLILSFSGSAGVRGGLNRGWDISKRRSQRKENSTDRKGEMNNKEIKGGI